MCKEFLEKQGTPQWSVSQWSTPGSCNICIASPSWKGRVCLIAMSNSEKWESWSSSTILETWDIIFHPLSPSENQAHPQRRSERCGGPEWTLVLDLSTWRLAPKASWVSKLGTLWWPNGSTCEKHVYTVYIYYIYIYISNTYTVYTCGCPIFLFIETAILREKKITFAKLSRSLCFSFAGVHHLLKPLNLVGTRFLNASARSVFGSAGGCYRQEAGVGAEFCWHMFSYMSIHGAVLPLKPRMPIASSCAVLP